MENKLKKQTACNNFDDKGKRTSQRQKRKIGKKITKQMKFCCKEKSYVKQH